MLIPPSSKHVKFGTGDDCVAGAKPARVQGVFGQWSQTRCDFWGRSVQSRELDLLILVGPFQLWILCNSVMFKWLKILLGCFTNNCCDHIKFRNLLRTVIFLMLESGWCSVKQISFLRQLAIFTAFVFQTDSVLQKAESLGIKQAAWLVCSNSLLDFVIYDLVPQTYWCVKPGLLLLHFFGEDS